MTAGPGETVSTGSLLFGDYVLRLWGMDKWQPISEAPRTGEPILANGPLGPHVVYWGRRTTDGGIEVGCPDAVDGRWIAADATNRSYQNATHYLPIPPLEACGPVGLSVEEGA